MNPRLTAFWFVLLLSTACRAADPAKITIDNYNKVVIGSSIQFVYSCLGKETNSAFYDGTSKTLTWKTDDATIVIAFKRNRVTEKWQTGL